MFSEVRDDILIMKSELDSIKRKFRYLLQSQSSNNKDTFTLHLSRSATEKLDYKFGEIAQKIQNDNETENKRD